MPRELLSQPGAGQESLLAPGASFSLGPAGTEETLGNAAPELRLSLLTRIGSLLRPRLLELVERGLLGS